MKRCTPLPHNFLLILVLKESLGMFKTQIFFLLSLLVLSCKKKETNSIEDTTVRLYEVYAARTDFEQFLSFYDNEMVLEDFIFGERIVGKANFRAFFDWPNPKFQLLEDSALVVEDITANGNKAIVRGYFKRFKWGDHTTERMHFTTILEFNADGKIVKHQDWINYPSSLIDYNKRKNSNDWLK